MVAYKKKNLKKKWLSNLRQIFETTCIVHAQVGRVKWTSATVASLPHFSQRFFNILYRGDH